MLEQARVAELIAFERIRRTWIIALTGTLYMLYEFMQIHLPNAISANLMAHYSLNAEQLGWLSSAYFYANLSLIIPAGLLLDRISVKKLIIFGMICTVIGPLAFALFLPFEMLVVGRAITGVGGAFSFIGCVKLASLWISPRNMGMITGIVAFMAMLGGLISQTPTAMMIEYTGLRNTLFAHVIVGILITGILALVISDKSPPFCAKTKDIMRWFVIKSHFKQLIGSRHNWSSALYAAAINQPMFLLGGLWGILYLQQVYNLTVVQASFITTMLFMGTVIGNPGLGWFSDMIKSRRLPMRLAAFLSLSCIAVLFFMPELSYTTLLITFFLLGLAQGGQVLSYPLITEINPRAMTATACSLVSFCTIGAVAFTQPLFGWLMSIHWDGTYIDGVAVYSASDYHTAFNIFVAAVLVMLVTSTIVKETRCKHIEETEESN